MAVRSQPPGPLPLPPPEAPVPAAGPGPGQRNDELFQLPPPAEASLVSQAATWLTCSVALVALFAQFGQVALGVALAATLGVGNVVGVATPVGGWFRVFPGIFAAVATAFLTSVALALTGAASPVVVLFLVAFVGGLDWRRVGRLLAPIWLAGLVVVILVAVQGGSSFPLAVCWLVLALATIWSLEQDRRRSLVHPDAVGPHPLPDDVGALDLLRVIGIALALGITLAFLLGTPSCSLRPPRSVQLMPTGSGSPPTSFADPTTGLTHPLAPDGWLPEGTGQVRPVPGGGVEVLGSDGVTRIYRTDDTGHSTVEVPSRTGDRRLEYRDDRGVYEVTELDPSGREGRHWYYTTDGRWREGDPSEVSGSPGQGDGSSGSGSSDGSGRTLKLPQLDWKAKFPRLPGFGDLSWLGWVLLAAAIVAGAFALWRWLPRRGVELEGDVSWALEVLADLEAAGTARGRPREPAETVLGYTEALAATVLPDERIAAVGRVLSGALFDRAEVSAYTRAWAGAVVAEVVAANPPERGRRLPSLSGDRAAR